MSDNTVIMVGAFEVPVTEELREIFARTHLMTSQNLPAEEQFDHDEQHLMLLACRVVSDEDMASQARKSKKMADREADLCELLHYLVMNRVPIREVLAEIRTFSTRTKQLSVRLCIEQRDAIRRARDFELEGEDESATSGAVITEDREHTSSMPLFIAPTPLVLAGAVA